jgi:large subunit ribosomal protein L31e
MERTYNIPLRKGFQKAPRYKRASKSIREIKAFIKKHMKVEKVVLGKYLNEEVWKNGPKNPPAKVSVKVIKEEDTARVELIGAPEEPKKEEEVKGKKKATKEKTPEVKEVPKTEETSKKESKEEIKTEMPKEEPKVEEKIPKAKDLVKKKEPAKKVPKASDLKKNSKNQKG